MFPARKSAAYDLQIEWTRPAEHGGVEVFDIYGYRDSLGGWRVLRADIIDEDGEPISFNLASFSAEEFVAIQNAFHDEDAGLTATRQ